MREENLFINEYNKANKINRKKDLDIFDECYFSYLDILSEKEVEVNSKVYSDCKCVSSTNFSVYYEKCEKCNGKGVLLLNGNSVICNHCRGKKAVVKVECPLCKGETKLVKEGKVKVKLNRTLKENDVVTLVNKGKESNGVYGDLYIKVKISDLNCFEIRGNDVYDKRIIEFNKEEITKGISKSVQTVDGNVSVKSNGEKLEEIVKLEGKGLNGGDFYICLNNELIPIRGKDLYKNIIVKKDMLDFYISNDELYSDKKCLEISYYRKLNDNDYRYISLDDVNNFKIVKLKGEGSKGINGGSNGDLYLRIFYSDEFVSADDKLYYKPIKLTKHESLDGKKIIEFNKEKVNLSFDKKLSEEKVIEVKNLGFMKDKNSFDSAYFIVSPYEYDVYKVRVKVRKKDKVIYLKDYKKYFYEYVNFNYKEGLKVVLNKNNEVVVFDELGNKVIVKVER